LAPSLDDVSGVEEYGQIFGQVLDGEFLHVAGLFDDHQFLLQGFRKRCVAALFQLCIPVDQEDLEIVVGEGATQGAHLRLGRRSR